MSDLSKRLADLSPERRQLLAQALRQQGAEFNSFPLSFAQQRLWFLDQWTPGNPAYNIPGAVRLTGALRPCDLRRAIEAIVRRHEILRTTFVQAAGQPVQIVHPLAPLAMPVVDLQALPAPTRAAQARALAAAEARRAFDLARGPLIRTTLLRLDPGEHILLLTMHHIVTDGWSLGIFLRELAAFYRDGARRNGKRAPAPPDLPIQYADYAAWQRERMDGAQAQIGYWRAQLAGAAPLDLPTDRPRPPAPRFRGARHALVLPAPLADALGALARSAGATLFMALLAGWQALLMRYSGQRDIVVGSPIAGRTRAETEPLIGFFVNTLALRTNLSGAPSFAEALDRVRRTALDAYANQDAPFEQLAELLQPERDLRQPPLTQAMFALQNTPMPPLELDGLTLQLAPVENGTAKFDLTLDLTETPDGLAGWIEYDSDLFEAATIARMAGHLRALLAAITADPRRSIADAALLSGPERHQIAVEWNDADARYPRDAGIHELFASQAARTPDAVALAFGTDEGQRTKDRGDDSSLAVRPSSLVVQMSYGALERRANQLARRLRAMGVGPEDRVGVQMERSPALIVALLGVLKAGGCYVPLDPSYPPDRRRFMLEDSQARVLITRVEGVLGEGAAVPHAASRTVDLCADWPEIARLPDGPLEELAHRSDLAYVMYTSGSTGRPKGIAITHRAIARLVMNADYVRLAADDHVAQAANASFDAATFEIWGALLHGARLVGIGQEVILSPQAFAEAIRAQRISALFLTTALFNQIVAVAPGAFASVRHLLFGGEAVDTRWVRAALRQGPPARLLHVYGPTESTTFASWQRIRAVAESDATVPIGRPIANTRIYLLDDRLHPVPIGVAGEIHIGGPGLARGYFGRPDLTAAAFVPDPFSAVGSWQSTVGSIHSANDRRLPTADCRLYRTGDLARFRADGAIEFLGRRDQQVKLRGFRIEPDEIAAVLGRHPRVRECAVVAREDAPGARRLVAYVVQGSGVRGQGSADPASAILTRTPSRTGCAPTSQGSDDPASAILTPDPRSLIPDLREWLRARLPDYMVPSAFVALEDLPLTPNGKIDRRALPPPAEASESELEFVAPRTPVEALLADIWGDVLGRERVGADDNFFALGGHSLLATSLISRVRETFAIDLPLRALFEHSTVAELAAQVEQARGAPSREQSPPLAPAAPADRLPLSFAQQRLWFLDQLAPNNPFYNIAIPARLRGPLDIGAFRGSLAAIVRRHEALHTTFAAVDGQPIQVVSPRAGVRLPLFDLAGLPPATRAQACDRLAFEDAQRPFDLARGPILRAALLRCGRADHLLLLTIHHIAADGWSMGVLLRELAALYAARRAGRAPELPDLPIQYADFAAWQRDWLRGDALDRQLGYWRAQLAGVAPLALPTDRPRPAVETFRGASRPAALAPSLIAALTALSRREGSTLFMTLLAAFQTLLYRYTGQRDIAVGSPIANRTRPELERLIGFFVNTLVLRVDLGGDPTFRTLLGRVRAATLAAYEHQDIPFEQLVEALQPERDMSRHPLFQVMFVLQNAPLPALRLADIALDPLLNASNGIAKFDITFFLWEERGGLAGRLEYNSDLFDATTIARMLGQFEALLGAILADPRQRIGRIPLLGAAARQQILAEWNATAAPPVYGDCVHRIVAGVAARVPDRVAVAFEGQHLSYAALDARANRLAHELRALGVGPEALAGICLDRSLDLAVGVLATLKAGGGVVALDPTYPRDRLAFMIADAGMPTLLIHTWLMDALPSRATTIRMDAAEDRARIARRPGSCPPDRALLDNLMYAMYTSGSTGTPKGIGVAHRAFLNVLEWQATHPTLAHPADIVQFATFGFCVSFQEIFATLCAGSTLVMVSEAQRKDFEALAETLARRSIERIYLPFAALKHLAEVCAAAPRAAPQLREVITAGEQLQTTPAILRMFERGGGALHNQYGASETHVVSSFTLTGAPARWPTIPPIGRPIDNTQIYLLDADLRPTPPGAPGEVCVGGVNLARCYLHDPVLTALRFVPNPFAQGSGVGGRGSGSRKQGADPEPRPLIPDSRLYRTGDLARYLPDGTIAYLGRGDDQVKIRGFRVELGEVELALRAHPSVADAAVLADERASAGKRLVAYIVQGSGVGGQGLADPSSELLIPDPRPLIPALRDWLRARLPEYMIPAAFVALDRLPINANGKLDRQALPAPQLDEDQAGFTPPRTPTEALLAQIWADVLGRERVGAQDHFFSIGGHSLIATQAISRARAAFKVDLPLRALFEHPTVAGLAARIDQARDAGRVIQPPPIRRAARDVPLPLSFSQQRLWFIEQLSPGLAAYNFPAAARLSGSLDAPALARALAALTRRHEILRSRFTTLDEQPVQVADAAGSVALPLIDLRALPADARAAEAQRLLVQASQRPFDLARGPVFRAELLRIDANEHILSLMMHHIVADGWSAGVLIRDLGALYDAAARGRPGPLPDLPIQYADYAAWQRQWMAGPALHAQREYWRARLANPPALDLPADFARPAVQSFRGATRYFTLPPDLSAEVAALARREGVTLFMALLAAFQCLLRHHAGSDDIVVGADVAGRSRPETEGLIGLFVNQLVLRTSLAGDPSFRALIGRVRETALDAYANQDVPFEQLVAELAPERSLSRNPLFQVMFILENTPMAPLDLPGLTITPLAVDNGTVHFDLIFILRETPDGIACAVQYGSDLFREATIARMWGQFERLLRAAAADPEARIGALLDPLAAEDRERRADRAGELAAANLRQLKQIRRRPASDPPR